MSILNIHISVFLKCVAVVHMKGLQQNSLSAEICVCLCVILHSSLTLFDRHFSSNTQIWLTNIKTSTSVWAMMREIAYTHRRGAVAAAGLYGFIVWLTHIHRTEGEKNGLHLFLSGYLRRSHSGCSYQGIAATAVMLSSETQWIVFIRRVCGVKLKVSNWEKFSWHVLLFSICFLALY